MKIQISHKFKSSNFDNRLNNAKIKYIIIHYTETKSLEEAIKLLTSDTRKVSCHYIIDCNGLIYNLVDESKRAWHAGISCWKKKTDLNNNSLGIELVNLGEKSKSKFSNKQILSLLDLLFELKKKYTIKAANFLGHSDIAPSRKIDPGIYFPWKLLSKKSFGLWFEVPHKKENSKKLNKKDEEEFLKNLQKIGYSTQKIKDIDTNQKKDIINAFHRHFFSENLNNNPSVKSLVISEGLLKLK